MTPSPPAQAEASETVELTGIEQYALGLLVEEPGEVLQLVGKALRFGLDTPGVKDALTGEVDMSLTPRTALAKELGDVLAVIEYTLRRGVVDRDAVNKQQFRKLGKLLDPEALDNLGRRLAP